MKCCLISLEMFVFPFLFLSSVLDAFYDGRLYRCGIKFSGDNLNDTYEREANVASISSPDSQQESDDDGWQEREASRTHSVKFTTEDTPGIESGKEVGLPSTIFVLPKIHPLNNYGYIYHRSILDGNISLFIFNTTWLISNFQKQSEKQTNRLFFKTPGVYRERLSYDYKLNKAIKKK